MANATISVRKRRILFALLVFLLLVALFATVAFGKRTRRLVSGSRSVIAVTPAGLPWKDRVITIQAEGTNVFGIWDGLFELPMFLYSFPGGDRFLCVYDDDTAVLVFVVDCGFPKTNAPGQALWPPDSYTRDCLAGMMTNVVVQSAGMVRLPTYDEVSEVSSAVRTWTPKQFRSASFPAHNLGVYKHYFPRDFVLNALDTNRQSCWPR